MLRRVNTADCLVLGAALAAGVGVGAESAPEVDLANGRLRARVYLPEPRTGFYRGTRFDWSGVLGGLQYAGHEFYSTWFQRTDPKVPDFVYENGEIVAGPCTAITGPAEEFVTEGKALGFDEAKPGATFIKIGVGVLRRPDDRAYDPYRPYPIADGGRWTVTCATNTVEFRHELTDDSTGYAYDYRKTVSLLPDQPQMIISHAFRNTGRRVIRSSVYNHNFLYLDRHAPGPGLVLRTPFKLRSASPLDPRFAEVREKELVLAKPLTGEDRVYAVLSGFGTEAKDYDFRIESRDAGAGLRITGDRPLSRAALWTIRTSYAIEPFIDLTVEPGAEFTWRLQYEFSHHDDSHPDRGR
jgi:hypothetical protein